MKKAIFIILCLLMLTGCQAAEETKAETTPLPAAVRAPAGETKTVTLEGGSHTVVFEIPAAYTAEEATREQAREILVKDGDRDIISVGTGFFGVCGTGLKEEQAEIGGMPASIGYYDGSTIWSFAVFPDLSPAVYAVNHIYEGDWAEADAILQSIRIE